jgi:hypothetical protein
MPGAEEALNNSQNQQTQAAENAAETAGPRLFLRHAATPRYRFQPTISPAALLFQSLRRAHCGLGIRQVPSQMLIRWKPPPVSFCAQSWLGRAAATVPIVLF